MSSRREFLETLLGTTTVVFGSGIWKPAAKLLAPEPLVLASVPEEVFKLQAAFVGEIDELLKRHYLPRMRTLMKMSGVLERTITGEVSRKVDEEVERYGVPILVELGPANPAGGEPEIRTTPAIGQSHAAARIDRRRKSTRRAKMARLFAGGPESAPGASRA